MSLSIKENLPHNSPNLHSNNNSSSFIKQESSSSDLPSMIYLCRYRQRNRLIEVPITSEYYHQQNGISHEHLKNLIIQEFQLQQITKTTLIIQLWNEQYQEYIDIESFKRIPFEGRLQVLIENDINSTGDTVQNPPLQDEVDSSSQTNIKIERIYDESIDHTQHNIAYDLLPKPIDGIPIPRFPPHIAAFLNGNGNVNQLNPLVQSLYQEIVKYELYPNADELRSVVSRLVDRYPYCISVIGSIELLVRKLYYKFCNERKKYPIELKRRQSNKRKRHIRDDDLSMINHQANVSNDLDRLMHLWTSTINQQNSPRSGSSSNSLSPVDYHPLNLSISMNNNNLMCTE